jgi:ParB family transcriptional regulator, chromosome partitioning protein
MNNIVDIDISAISGASYNPRAISEEKIATLRESIECLGIIKPIIVRKEDGTILAGHQRTKSAKLSGYSTIKGFYLTDVNSTDEVRFNQLHNLSECEISEKAPVILVTALIPAGEFSIVKNRDIQIISPGEKNQAVNQLSKLILRYGQFANAIINQDGRVIISAVYAKAVKLLGLDLWVYRIPKEKEILALKYFSMEYGQFSYEHIERKTYIQSLAQKNRLRSESHSRSTLYEKVILPKLSKNDNALDFGAGQRDYSKMLSKKGYRIFPLEFYLRRPGADVIWMSEIIRDFQRIENHLATIGQFDVVICDSVMNSVDSIQAQNSVLITLSALCKKGGTIFWSGIPLKFKKMHINRKNTFDNKESAAFLDDNGFTGNYRYGEWYFQKYHTRSEVETLNRKYFSNRFSVYDRGLISPSGELNGSAYQVETVNDKLPSEKEVIEALTFEFSLPLPGGERHQLVDRILSAYQKSMDLQ